ncbi:MAG: serine hydrolase [Fuerstiella sp.]|nr:serine hydrolase [Fuerstiella sp.]
MLIFLLAVFVSQGLGAQEATEKPLAERLLPLIAAHEGEVAVSVRHIGNGEEFHYRSDVVMPTASLIKLPIMIEAYRQAAEGIIDLQATVDWTDTDKVVGSGILTKHLTGGSKLSLSDLVRLMIASSDNTATNLVVDRIGLDATAREMASLGFPETRLHSKVYRENTSTFPGRSRKYGFGSTKPSRNVSGSVSLSDRPDIS